MLHPRYDDQVPCRARVVVSALSPGVIQERFRVAYKASLQRPPHQQQVARQLGRHLRARRGYGDRRHRIGVLDPKGHGHAAAHRVAQNGYPLRIAIAAGQRLRQRRLGRSLQAAALRTRGHRLRIGAVSFEIPQHGGVSGVGQGQGKAAHDRRRAREPVGDQHQGTAARVHALRGHHHQPRLGIAHRRDLQAARRRPDPPHRQHRQHQPQPDQDPMPLLHASFLSTVSLRSFRALPDRVGGWCPFYCLTVYYLTLPPSHGCYGWWRVMRSACFYRFLAIHVEWSVDAGSVCVTVPSRCHACRVLVSGDGRAGRVPTEKDTAPPHPAPLCAIRAIRGPRPVFTHAISAGSGKSVPLPP